MDEKTERLGEVKARQVVWTKWMADATAGLDDDDLVVTSTERTPFGNYLLGVRAATCHDCGSTSVIAESGAIFCVDCGLNYRIEVS